MKFFFVGIKGTGMSALAILMQELGYEVLGSDKDEHFFTEEELLKNNIKILNFSKNNIKRDYIIVKGNTFNEDHEEIKEAIRLNLTIYSYQEMIRIITDKFNLIAISGSHGKTTTTKMFATSFDEFGINFLIGDGTGKGTKDNKYFALEACEWKRHFLEYNPNYVIIINIDLDHTDYYKDINDIIDSFNSFAAKAKRAVIICGDNEYCPRINSNKEIITYGFNESNNLVAKNISFNENTSICDIYINNKFYYKVSFPFTLKHLILNALSVIAVAYLEKLDMNILQRNIMKITPAKRRFNIEEYKSNIIIDDYAHHPTEISTTITAAKEKYVGKKIIAIFMPHTKSRVYKFKKEFADSLSIADRAFITDIVEDRIEIGYESVSSKDIIKYSNKIEYISLDTIDKLKAYNNSVLLFMSSKNIYEYINKFKEL